MSKGRRMTYEELCNAVLPVWFFISVVFVVSTFIFLLLWVEMGCLWLNVFYSCVLSQHWHNLRKHNGERYAYSSHSQAVLDCLRNRHEWARLVDRGPKVCICNYHDHSLTVYCLLNNDEDFIFKNPINRDLNLPNYPIMFCLEFCATSICEQWESWLHLFLLLPRKAFDFSQDVRC